MLLVRFIRVSKKTFIFLIFFFSFDADDLNVIIPDVCFKY